MIDFGNVLRALRLAEERTQSEVACEVGVTGSMISAYENGLRQPSYAVLLKLADLFGVSTDFILGHSCEKNGYSLDGLTAEQMETVLKIIKNMKTANWS